MTGPYPVILSAPVWQELDAIHDSIAEDSQQNAARFVRRLIDAMCGLEEAPASFSVAGRMSSTGGPVHKIVEWPYLIYYRVDESPPLVTILRVLHGARRQPRRFE